MAIVTDPDTLTRYMCVFGTGSQKVSVYPIGDTLRGANTVVDAFVATTGTIERASGSWSVTDSVVAGDVSVILDSVDAGHYFVNTSVPATLTLTDIDDGTAGSATTNLSVNDSGVFQSANINFSTEAIKIDAHGYTTGHALVYDVGSGGTAPTGIANGEVVYAVYEDVDNIGLANTYADAIAGTRIDLTAGSMAGTAHILHDRILVRTFNNGASASESIGGNDTSGDADGDIVDGATLQCIYSFGKEEWKDDLLSAAVPGSSWNDDLIRHEFPFESITAEQFEIGGGTSHDNWNWFNAYSEKKVRTGGWAAKVSATSGDLARSTGIITLGTLDTDASVYYQQTSTVTTPVNFTFLGAVNEALEIYTDATADDTPDSSFLTYLKLFVRKKARSYAQSEIADIGVSSIQTIVNRFPLSHAVDSAITVEDGQLLGTSPYRGVTLVTGADRIDGAFSTGAMTFTDADATFQGDGVVAGDVLRITSAPSATTDVGYYTIASVGSETELTIQADFEFSGWLGTEAAAVYTISTPVINGVTKATGVITDLTDGVATDVDGDTGTFASAAATFNADASPLFTVAAGDILWIKETGSSLYGIYEVNSVTNATTIVVKTPDVTFAGETALDYRIFKAGMYLEYKNEASAVQPSGATSIAFDDDDASYGNRPSITLTGATWNADVVAGTIIEITNSEGSGENDGSYTVFAQETSAIVSLVPTDVLILNAADTTADANAFNGFKRTIGSVVYAFNWKVSGNVGGLDDVFQFIQHQLRQTSNIDYGEGLDAGAIPRGDITNLLMTFSSPTGTGINLIIDDVDPNDINNATFQDATGVNRNYPFTAAGNLSFNTNLTGDADAKYWLFFTNDDAGDNIGRDYGSEYAIVVQDDQAADISGDISAQSTIAFTYAYDTNVQRGAGSVATNAPVTLVAIGLETAQFVITTGTITRATGITISAVAALERNYLNV